MKAKISKEENSKSSAEDLIAEPQLNSHLERRKSDIDAAKQIVGNSVCLLVIGSLFLTGIVQVFTEDILRELNTPKSSEVLAASYARIMLLGMPISYLYGLVIAMLRAALGSR